MGAKGIGVGDRGFSTDFKLERAETFARIWFGFWGSALGRFRADKRGDVEGL